MSKETERPRRRRGPALLPDLHSGQHLTTRRGLPVYVNAVQLRVDDEPLVAFRYLRSGRTLSLPMGRAQRWLRGATVQQGDDKAENVVGFVGLHAIPTVHPSTLQWLEEHLEVREALDDGGPDDARDLVHLRRIRDALKGGS